MNDNELQDKRAGYRAGYTADDKYDEPYDYDDDHHHDNNAEDRRRYKHRLLPDSHDDGSPCRNRLWCQKT